MAGNRCDRDIDNIHWLVASGVAIVMLVVGILFGLVIFGDSGRGKPATMEVGKIYKVHAFVQLDTINWLERSEGLLVKEEAQGTYPQFVEVPRREVEGEIVVGKGIMKLLVQFGQGASEAPRYKTGELVDLRAELEKLKGK